MDNEASSFWLGLIPDEKRFSHTRNVNQKNIVSLFMWTVKEWCSNWHFRKSTNTVITIGEIQVAKIWASCGIGGIAEAWAKSSCKLRSNFLQLDQPIKPRVVMMMIMIYWWWLWWLWLCWQWWKNNYSWLWLSVCLLYFHARQCR